MSSIIKYVNETDIATIVNSVINNKKDVWSVINQIKDERAAFIEKSNELIEELTKLTAGDCL